MKFFLRRKSTSFRTQRIVAKDVDLRPSAPKVLTVIAMIYFSFCPPTGVFCLNSLQFLV